MLSQKGGVGKTTTTVGLGATLASLRGDRVIALDANPDRGTLASRIRTESAKSRRDLLKEHLHGQVHRYADIRAFTNQAPSRLEVLASTCDPTNSEALDAEDYSILARLLEQHYSITITDCGTNLLDPAMTAILESAHQVVVVTAPSVDSAELTDFSLDWLNAHGYQHLAETATIVVSKVERSKRRNVVDLDALNGYFADRCRTVVTIPADDHLSEGGEVTLDRLDAATRDAYLVLAAAVGELFTR